MNLKERLKEAYENVLFSADTTWSNTQDLPYHNANKELYLKELQFQHQKFQVKRPRTVRESIPKSRLAQYNNYVYNESREMSYASSASKDESELYLDAPSEPWQMVQVSELYRWFLVKKTEDNLTRFLNCIESPLLNVNNFEEKILKILVTEDRIKKIWNQNKDERKSEEISLNVFTSPLGTVLLEEKDPPNDEWFWNLSKAQDLGQLEELNSFFENIVKSSNLTQNDAMASDVLYSEVLQGLGPNRKFLSATKSDKNIEESSGHKLESFTNFTVLNRQKHSKFFHDSKSGMETNPRSVRATHPLSGVPQGYFYSPIQTLQRCVPPYYPQIYVCPQNPILSNTSVHYGHKEEKREQDDLEGTPITTTLSHELEIQALQQYNNSNENFYQDLERQAIEHYSTQD